MPIDRGQAISAMTEAALRLGLCVGSHRVEIVKTVRDASLGVEVVHARCLEGCGHLRPYAWPTRRSAP